MSVESNVIITTGEEVVTPQKAERILAECNISKKKVIYFCLPRRCGATSLHHLWAAKRAKELGQEITVAFVSSGKPTQYVTVKPDVYDGYLKTLRTVPGMRNALDTFETTTTELVAEKGTDINITINR